MQRLCAAGGCYTEVYSSLSAGKIEILDGSELRLVDGTLIAADAVIVNSGNLVGSGVINGDVIIQGDGTVDPGFSPGEIFVDGDYHQLINSWLTLEVGGLLAGEDYDLLSIFGDAYFEAGSNISIEFINGFKPKEGDAFDLISAASLSGDLDLVNFYFMGLGEGFEFDFGFNETGFGLTKTNVSAVPVPGAVWLFSSGLMGLIGMAGRKKVA